MAFKEDRVQTTILVNAQQAVNQLGRLEMEAKELKQSLKNMKRGTEEYVQTSKKLRDTTKDIKALRSQIGAAGMTLGQLVRQQRELRRELNFTTRGTAQYDRLKKQYQELTGVIRERRKELAQTEPFMRRFGKGLERAGNLGAAATGLIMVFQGIASALNSTISGMADLSDSIADVQKTTGLTRKEVDELNASFKRLDTRTSRKELLALAQIAGKLGVQGRQNVEGFVKSADKLVVALGEDLGGNAEDTIKAVGKLVDLFKVKEKYGLEDGLTKVGSAINSLGAASSASESYLVDFAKRLGGIAPNANIGIPEVLGLAATLDQLGQTSETSSTAMSQLLVSLGRDLPSFAQIAGLEVSDFAKLLEEDANEALIKVIEGAKSTKDGIAGMAETLNALGVDGARAASVVGVLSNNVELLREQQALANREFDSGTSILQEFNTKNENFAAQLEKLRKKLYALFVNSSLMKGLELFVGRLNEMLMVTESTTQAIRKETAEMNSLFAIIKSTSTETQIRKQAIDQLNTAYGQYLPNLLTEKSTLQEIELAQSEANKALVQNIILKKEQERIEKAVLDDMASQKSILADLEAENRKILYYQKELEKAQLENEKSIADGSMTDELALYYQNRIDNAQRGIDVATKEIELLNEFAKSVASGVSVEIIQKETDRMLKSFGLDRASRLRRSEDAERPDTNAISSPNPNSSPIGSDAEKKKLDDLLAKWQAFQEEIKRMQEERNLLMQDSDIQELARLDAKYEGLLNRAREFHESGTISESEYLGMLREIHRQHAEELKAFDADRKEEMLKEEAEFYEKHSQQVAEANARELKQKQELFEAQMFLLNSYSDLAGATQELVGQQGEKGAAFAKQLAVFQLAIDTATAISAAVAGASKAASAGGPAAPFLLAGYITSMVATVVAGIAKARKLLGTEPPEKPKYAGGGYTGLAYGSPDQTGFRVAGEVHEEEYVVPRWLLKGNQYVANQVAMIEAIRTGRGVNTSSNAPTANASSPQAGSAQSEQNLVMLELLQEMRQNNRLLSELKEKKSYALFTKETLDQVDEYQAQVLRNEEDSAL